MRRRSYTLSDAEERMWSALRRVPLAERAAAVWDFWARVAAARGLDYTTLLCDGNKFSALPLGHTKHWCWPAPLRCARPPIAI